MGEKFLEIIRRFYFGCESTFDENDEKYFCCFGRVHVLTAAKYISIFQYIFLAIYSVLALWSAEFYFIAILNIILNVGFTSILTIIFGAVFNYLSGSTIGWFKPHVLIFSALTVRVSLPPFDTSNLNKEQIISIISSDLFSKISETFLAEYDVAYLMAFFYGTNWALIILSFWFFNTVFYCKLYLAELEKHQKSKIAAVTSNKDNATAGLEAKDIQMSAKIEEF